MFLLVTSASFIESGSDTCTGNLLERFAGDDEIARWLREEYSKVCTLQGLEPTRGQELAARCVVESRPATCRAKPAGSSIAICRRRWPCACC